MYNTEKSSEHFRVYFSATLENIDRADDDLDAYFKQYPCAVDVFAVRILLRESLLNAVMHGSSNNPEKKVVLDLHIRSDSLVMKVTDSGNGFNYNEHTSNIDGLEEGGRGLALMKIYADEVKFNDTGNEVTFKKLFKRVEEMAE